MKLKKIKIIFFVVVFIFIGVSGNTQSKFEIFPKTDYKIVLPDISFQVNHDSTGFFSEKYKSKIDLSLNENDELSSYSYSVFEEMILKEFSRPGISLIMDKKISNGIIRILKLKIDFDITDNAPSEKGASNILWILLLNDNNKPITLTAEYRLKFDTELNDSFLTSLLTFSKK